jgi:hypothetical protein
VDVNNASELALAAGPAPSGDPLASPPRVRWRQRAVGRCRAAPAGDRDLRQAQIAPCSAQTAGPTTAATGDGHEDRSASTAGVAAVHRAVMGPGDGSPVDALANSTGVGDVAEAPDSMRPPSSPTTVGPIDTDIATVADDHPQAAEPAFAAEPQQAPRDIELWLLARRAQGAALRLDFELRTALARQVFRRDFVYVSRQLHALEASRRVQGLDRTRLNDALATLRERADSIHAFMAQRTAELQASIEAQGPAGARIAFARPARFQASIVSPGAHRFLSLLMQADETLARLEMAWLLGLVEPANRTALVSDCRRALLGFKDLACDLRHAMGVLVQEVNAQRRDGCAAAPDE